MEVGMESIITLPDERLRYIYHSTHSKKVEMHVESTSIEATCPYCKTVSQKVHSKYIRKLWDLPIQGKKTLLHLHNKKYFCANKSCGHKTFAEQFAFYEPNAVRTNRLHDEILRISITQSSVSAAKYLRESVTEVGKSTICEMVKKTKDKCG